MHTLHRGFVGLTLGLLLATSANAALVSRLSGQAYYDDILDITWIADTKLADTTTFGVLGINPGGRMTWAKANEWIAAMNTAAYLGKSDWRLPTVTDTGTAGCDIAFTGTDCGYNVDLATGEMAHMFYSTLGNTGYYDTSGGLTGCAGPSLCLTNAGPFSNLQPDSYWSGTEYVNTTLAWRFVFQYGNQGFYDKDIAGPYAWAVRDGDIGPAGQVIVSNLTEPYNFGAGLGGVWVEASSFTTGAQSSYLNSITLDLQVNSPSTVALSLFNDSGGLPGTPVEDLGTQFINANGGDYDTVYPASGATLLQANTKYWLVVEQSGAGSTSWVSTYSTAETSASGVTIGNDMYYHSVGGGAWTAHAGATDTGQFAINATSSAGAAYNLVGYYHRDETFSPGKLYSFAFKAGAAQGCPGPTYTQPCYNPAGPSPGGTWVAANGVATDIISAGQPTWTWNGTTLTSTGTFWATLFVNSNPNGSPLLSDKVTDLTITPSTSTTNAASYECVEGTFYATVAMSGCKFTVLGSNLLDDSSANWNVGANPKCVTMTIGGDDYSLFDGLPGVPGTPSPRGLTAQAAGQAGVGCAQTSAGPIGTSGAFDLWNVVVDDGTNLILANTTNIGACYLFGSGPTPACPDDVALAGISYLVLVKASAPDGDSDGVPDATDNCPLTANADQADTDADSVGDVCDNCSAIANPTQADDDSDLRGNLCDNCRTIANNTGAGAQCDSDGDGYGNRCDADLNNNGATNAFDSPLFRAQFGAGSTPPTYNKADLNCSGIVNAFDTPLFRSLLGAPPGPGAGP